MDGEWIDVENANSNPNWEAFEKAIEEAQATSAATLELLQKGKSLLYQRPFEPRREPA